MATGTVSCGHPSTEFALVINADPMPFSAVLQKDSPLYEVQKSVFFVRVEFKYIYNSMPYTISGWATAFPISKRKIVTCKHVVYPEKYDYNYNFYSVNGNITHVSRKIYLWRPGQIHTTPDGKYNVAVALQLGRDFKIARTLPDVLTEHKVARDEGPRSFYTHATSTNDVALFEAKRDLVVKPLKLGSITDADKGKKVILIGYPLGLRSMDTKVVNPFVSVGYVRKVETYIRFTSPVIGGNSGGPVVTEDGTVVGIVAFRFTEAIGFALKTDRIRLLLR